MSGTGVITSNFSLFVDNTSANQLTIAAVGVQYEIIGVRVQDNVGGTAGIEVRQTDNAGLIIAGPTTTPAGANNSFIQLNAIRNNRIIPATTPIFIEPISADITLVELICIGVQGVTPPEFVGVSPLTIATGP